MLHYLQYLKNQLQLAPKNIINNIEARPKMSQRSASPYSDRNTKKKKQIKHKLDFQGQKISQSGQCKITNFFKTMQKRPKQQPKPVQKILMRLQAQLQNLKQQQNRMICEKEQIIQEQIQMKGQFESWMRKSKDIVQDCMKGIYQYARDRKGEIDIEKGFYDKDCRVFTQGTFGQTIQSQKQALQKSLQSQHDTTPLSHHLLHQQYLLKCNQFEQSKRQLLSYKQRLKLSHEQKSCKFANQWPLLNNRYQILELIGKGGFSQVYKGYDLENNRYVGVKVSQTSAFKGEIAHYIVREYENHIKLEHENIAKLYEVIQMPGYVCIALEYCQGPQLSTYIKQNKPLSQQKCKCILQQILRALDYLSKLNPKIIHYDLKPQNIMFCNGKIKILDFGLSKQIDNQHSKIALSNQGIGTYWYLPPQSFKEKNPEISQKVDVWSAGVIFYEMLTGRKPFGHNKSQSTVYQEGIILQANRVQFADDIQISENAKSLIRHCLAYNAEDRYTPSQALAHRFFK